MSGLLLPRTDAGVLLEAVVAVVTAGLLWVPARRARLLTLWFGSVLTVAGLFLLRAVH